MNHIGLNISHGEAAGRHSPFQLLHVSGAYLHNESQGIHLSPNETECEQCSVPDRQLCKDLMRCLHHEPCVVTRLPIPHLSTPTLNRAFYKQYPVSVVVVSVSLTLSVLSSTSPFLSVFTLPDPPAAVRLSTSCTIYDPVS